MRPSLVRCSVASIIALMISSGTVSAQTTNDSQKFFIFGTAMGFASFQARAAGGSCSGPAHDLYIDAISQAQGYAKDLQSRFVDLDVVGILNFEKCASGEQVEVLRSKVSGGLIRYGGDYKNLFAFGVNLAIAEAQAQVGEAARKIVLSSLTLAKYQAEALSDPIRPDLSGLRESISMAERTTSLDEIHTKVLNLRVSYQAQFYRE